MEPERDWTALPSPILQVFGQHLSAPGLKHALESCKSWREPVRHGVESFAVSFPAADDLGLTVGQTAGQRLLHVGRALPQLMRLQMTFFAEPDSCAGALDTLAGSLPALQELRLTFQPEQQHSASRALHEVLAPLPQLTSLHLETHMQLLDWSFLHTIAGLTQLRTLALRLNLQLPAAAVDIAALQPLTQLRHFELRMAFLEPPGGILPAATISTEALDLLGAAWPHLRSLSLVASAWDFSPAFSGSLQRFRRLQALCISVEEPYELASLAGVPTISSRLSDIPASVQEAKLSNITVLAGRHVTHVAGREGTAAQHGPPKLEILELVNCVAEEPDLAKALSCCPQLRSVVVDRIALAGEALAQWKQRLLV